MELSDWEMSIEEQVNSAEHTVAFPDCEDIRVFEACRYLITRNKILKIIFFKKKSLEKFSKLFADNLDKKKLALADDLVSDLASKDLLLNSKKKASSSINADNRLLYQAGYLLKIGKVDLVLAGNLMSSAEVIRSAVYTVGFESRDSVLSGVFIMSKPSEKRLYLFSDCAVNADPNVDEIVRFSENAVNFWSSLFQENVVPVVAFLSFSTRGSSRADSAKKMSSVYEKFRMNNSDVNSYGEIQFDVAINPEISQKKAPGNPIMGKSNIFIFPNLDSANISYKVTQRLGGFDAYGPFLLGLKKPFCDLSRGASVKDIVMTAYFNMLRLQ